MSLCYIIDGYNMLKHPAFVRCIDKKIKDVKILLDFVLARRLTGSRKNKIIVVFDGYPPASTSESRQYNNIDALFAKKYSADELIKKMVEKSANPKNIVVVSDDREIKFSVRPLGARVVSVEEFINVKEKEQKFLEKRDFFKPELSQSQICQINEELRKIWLK